MIKTAFQTLLRDESFGSRVDLTWLNISERYVYHDSQYKSPKMARRELGFHDEVKILAYVSHLTRSVPGDFLEIGVWKGKSLALIREFCDPEKRVIGIDPLIVPGQFDDFLYFHDAILKGVDFIHGFSEQGLSKVLGITNKLCAIHIDGGHLFNNVLTDFVLYDRLLSSGGIIVFDDYNDRLNSPEVKLAVDYLTRWFTGSDYEILGTLNKFPNPFVIVKR